MNPLAIEGGDVSVFTVPLKVPFVTALGRKSATTNAAVRLRLKGGWEGCGEASGSVVRADLSAGRLARALESELDRSVGKDARRLTLLVRGAWERMAGLPPAAAAFESALTSALAASRGLRLSQWFGGAMDTLETDVTVSAAGPREAAEAARRAAREGFRTLKVKVGTGPARDLARVLAACRAAASEGARPRVILDGNQSMTPASALRLVESCLKRGVRAVLIEQPLPREDLKGMARLRRRSPVPLAADESVRSPQEALRVLDLEAADVLNVKVAKTGLQGSLEIAALARAAGKKLMIGCMQETARGLSASVHLACGTGAFEFVDLDSDHLLAQPQPRGDFRRDGPRLML